MPDAIDLINAERGSRGFGVLKPHPGLAASASEHSLDMARMGRLSHGGSDGSDPFERMSAEGVKWTGAGECVAWGQSSPERVVSDWMGDAPHRRILMDPSHNHIGIAVSESYWTADLCSCPDPDPEPPAPSPKPIHWDPW